MSLEAEALEAELKLARAELSKLLGKENKNLRSAKAKEIRELERRCMSAKAADKKSTNSADFAFPASLAEEQLAKVAEQEDKKPTLQQGRLNQSNVHPAGCSGKEMRKERKEIMKEFREQDRLSNLESRQTGGGGDEDGELLGDFVDVTAHRLKPANEYRVFSPPGLHSKIR